MIFLLQEGGEKCKMDMSGYPTMHSCDVSKPSANVWNLLQDTSSFFSPSSYMSNSVHIKFCLKVSARTPFRSAAA